MKVRYREQSLVDLEEIFTYLEQRNPDGARRVIGAIRAAINSVAERPLSARMTSDPTVRVKIVGRYQFKIFYSIGADEIEILHVRHGARRPWIVES